MSFTKKSVIAPWYNFNPRMKVFNMLKSTRSEFIMKSCINCLERQ